MDTKNDLSRIFTFGNLEKFKLLADKLNGMSSQDDDKVLNKVKIIDYNRLDICTKYYDVSVNIEGCFNRNEYDNVLKELEKESANFEGTLIVLDELENFEIKFLENLTESLNKINEDCLKILVLLNPISKVFDRRMKDLLQGYTIVILDLENSDLKTENSAEINDDEAEDEFDALDELINSLFVHDWSNMKLKNENPKKETLKPESDDSKSDTKNNQAASENSNEEDDTDTFENLLMNLSEFRLKASALDFEDRKKYAENVVLNFWKSIGGNEDEIANLDDDIEDLD